MNLLRLLSAPVCIVASLTLLAPALHAAPGDLDPWFGGFGSQAIVTTAGATSAMALAPDGKIVTAGTSGVQIVVRRYMPNGAPDLTFDADGVATYSTLAFAMRANAVAVQPDGKIVVAGWAEAETDDFLIARVHPSGTLDYGFGGTGYRTIDFAGQGDQAEAVVVQPDGKIVVAGTSRVGGDDDFSVARWNANGTLDTTFSQDGRLTIGFGGDDACHDVALQEDGKIVLVGDGSEGFPTYDRDLCIARLHGDGSFDGGLDGDGKRTAGLGDSYDVGSAVAVQADGRIVVAGYSGNLPSDGKLFRMFDNGVPDPTLDGDGIMSLPESERPRDMLIQPDGRILIVSEYSTTSDNAVVVHRLLPTGEADATFDGDGRALYDAGIYDKASGLALLPDGRILFHATTGPDFWTQNATVLVRVWQDGSEDRGGQQAANFPPPFMGPGALARGAGAVVQPDGKIIVAGELTNASNSESDFGLARFQADGEPDLSFGTNGLTSFSFHNYDIARAVALQSDGKIVVAGTTGHPNAINVLVARFNADGTLDNTFGFFGYNVLDFLGGPDYAQAVTIAPDGKIVVAGTVYNGARYVFGVCRFTVDGIVDSSFDIDGKQLHELTFGALHEATAVVVQPDLKIVVGGHVDYNFALARYHESGAVDFGFGPNGQGYTIFQMGGPAYLSCLALAPVGVNPPGLIYAAGSRTASGNTDFAVAQVNSAGYVGACECFPCCTWLHGRAYADWGGYDAAYAIDVRSDGRVAVAGVASGQLGWAQFGQTSSTSSADGTTDLPGQGESAQAVRFFGPNQLILAGTQDFNGTMNFALARFETSWNATVGVGDPVVAAPPGWLSLAPTCPNPTSGRTLIAFDLAREDAVRIGLYDVAGRRVRTLADGLQPAGRHELVWDGQDERGRPVAAGIYFVHADVAQTRTTQKLLVLR